MEQETNQNPKEDFVKKSIPVFLIFGILFGLGVLGVWLAPEIKKNKEPSQKPSLITEQKSKEPLSTSEEKTEELPITSQKEESSKGEEELIILKGKCQTENSCYNQTPGHLFRCNSEGEYNFNDKYYCECLADCSVKVFSESDITFGNICILANGCFGKPLGSFYRCDENGYYNISGAYACTCESDCAVTKKSEKVCVSYFRKTGSTRMIMGTWNNVPSATISITACYNYMKENILDKPNCAQPDGEYITIVLIDKSKRTYDMPDIDMSTELVHSQNCKTGTADCPLPYHGKNADGWCVWSCGVGTTPDSVTNECVCEPGYAEIGEDQFGRRICGKAD